MPNSLTTLPVKITERYQKVWEAIKADGECTLLAHPALVRRIKKGVIKQKDKDLGFKILNEHDKAYLKITITEVNQMVSEINFVLKQRIGIDKLTGTGYQ